MDGLAWVVAAVGFAAGAICGAAATFFAMLIIGAAVGSRVPVR